MLAQSLLVLLTLATTMPAAASPGLDALNRFYNEVRSLDTEFYQVLIDGDGEIVQKGRGRFLLTRPSRFRWEYQEPFRQLIISDGRLFWFYDVDLAQVTERSAADTLQGSPAALLAGGGDINAQFVVTDLGARRDLHWVRLVPRQQNGDFSEILLAFTQSQRPKLMELRDTLGQTTQITFDNLHINPRVSERSFQFQPPPGVEVIRDGLGLQTYPEQ